MFDADAHDAMPIDAGTDWLESVLSKIIEEADGGLAAAGDAEVDAGACDRDSEYSEPSPPPSESEAPTTAFSADEEYHHMPEILQRTHACTTVEELCRMAGYEATYNSYVRKLEGLVNGRRDVGYWRIAFEGKCFVGTCRLHPRCELFIDVGGRWLDGQSTVRRCLIAAESCDVAEHQVLEQRLRRTWTRA